MMSLLPKDTGPDFRLPACTQGQVYRYSFSDDLVDSLQEMVLPAGISEKWVFDGRCLSGTPSEPGEFEVLLKIKGHPEPLKVLLEVLPDPRLLWENKPIDANAPFVSQDFQFLQISTGKNSSMVGASLRGRRHAHEGRFRDDYFAICPIQDSGVVFALADGAGSAKYARLGSRLACENAIRCFIEQGDFDGFPDAFEQFSGTALKRSVEIARNALLEAAMSQGLELKDLATTFSLGFVFWKAGEVFLGGIGVGDCAIAFLDADFQPSMLYAPEQGQFAGETRFLTDSNLLPGNLEGCLLRVPSRSFRHLVAFTDGILDGKFEDNDSLMQPEAWKALIDSFPQVQEAEGELWRAWLEFWSRGEHDDRTILWMNHEA